MIDLCDLFGFRLPDRSTRDVAARVPGRKAERAWAKLRGRYVISSGRASSEIGLLCLPHAITHSPVISHDGSELILLLTRSHSQVQRVGRSVKPGGRWPDRTMTRSPPFGYVFLSVLKQGVGGEMVEWKQRPGEWNGAPNSAAGLT